MNRWVRWYPFRSFRSVGVNVFAGPPGLALHLSLWRGVLVIAPPRWVR